MATNDRNPGDRNSAAPRRGRAQGSGAPRRDGAPKRDGGFKRDGGPKRDGAPRRDGAPKRDGGPRRDGGFTRDGGAKREDSPRREGGFSRDGTPRREGAPRRDGVFTRGGAPGRDRGPKHEGFERRGRGDDRERTPRTERPERKGPPAPEIPEEVVYGQLDRTVRARLRTLSKENAEDVGRHLIMAGQLLDTDPELAYQHAMVAASRGGRVDVVREAAAVTAYATGRYAEALRELRTVRRLNGSSEHLPLMADCERGLGRPERAIALANEPEAATLDARGKVELAIVVAGARSDMGDHEAALVQLKRLKVSDPEVKARIDEATAEVLRALGRIDEAEELERSIPEPVVEVEEEDVVVYDTFEETDESSEDAPSEQGAPTADPSQPTVEDQP